MKFASLIVMLTLLSGYLHNVCAQDAPRQELSISIQSQVLNSIELLTIRDIDISNVQPGQNTLYINPATDPEAGLMKATGRPNANIRISFISNQVLTHREGLADIHFTYMIAGNDLDEQTSSELLDEESQDFSFNENGEYFFWIGGSANISNAPRGQYDGEFTIEIEYI